MLLLWAVSNPAKAALLSGASVVMLLVLSTVIRVLLLQADTTSKPALAVGSTLVKPFQYLKDRFDAWCFLIRGPAIIQAAYEKSNGKPFTVATPNNTILLVSDWRRINEINAAPEGTLSLRAAAKELLQPKHTMSNFDWLDKGGSDGAPLKVALQSRLTAHLPDLLPEIRRSLCTLFDSRFNALPTVNGIKQGQIFPTIIGAVIKSNAHALFGPELAGDSDFLKMGKDMIEHTLMMSELLRIVPDIIAEPLGKWLSSRLDSSRVMTETLVSAVSQRFEERERRKMGHDIPERRDCMQWIMDQSPKHKPWTVMRVVHELIALWFGSVHIASTTACVALFDLCDYPEYVDVLRQEIQRTGWKDFDSAGGRNLPLMDSFLKESARLTPIECVSTRRKVLKPFKFSDGTTAHPGQWVCSAPQAMNKDAATWEKPDMFYGFRFVKPDIIKETEINTTRPSELHLSTRNENFDIPQDAKSSAYTAISDWQQWGTGKAACPGRWYASAAVKTILGTLITKYDIELVNSKATRYFSWRTFLYPFEGTQITMFARPGAEEIMAR